MICFDIMEYIDLGSLFGFLAGAFFGIMIFALIYLYAVLRSLNKNRYLVKVQDYDIDGREIELLVKETQDCFKKNKGEDRDKGMIERAYTLTKKMSYEIAQKFFPNSKHPMLEISIDEALLLSTYITKRLEEILSYRGLKMFRKIRISTIYGWTEVKEKVDDNVLMKTNKKYRVSKKFKSVMGIINIVNPVYWAKRLIVNKTLDIVIRKICLITIGIVGEETYKIYSKRVFNEEMYIDTGVDDFIVELKEDLDREYDGLADEEV